MCEKKIRGYYQDASQSLRHSEKYTSLSSSLPKPGCQGSIKQVPASSFFAEEVFFSTFNKAVLHGQIHSCKVPQNCKNKCLQHTCQLLQGRAHHVHMKTSLGRSCNFCLWKLNLNVEKPNPAADGMFKGHALFQSTQNICCRQRSASHATQQKPHLLFLFFSHLIIFFFFSIPLPFYLLFFHSPYCNNAFKCMFLK